MVLGTLMNLANNISEQHSNVSNKFIVSLLENVQNLLDI